MAERFLLVSLLFLLLFEWSFAANAARKKNINAVRSCGLNVSEVYFHVSQHKLLPFLRNHSNCDQDDPRYAHPPTAMVDGDFTTFWQSKGGVEDARITIDLSGQYQKFYYIKSITIHFGDFYRPDRMAFYKKSLNSGNSDFQPWHYLVTKSDDCQKKFGVPNVEMPAAADSILCQRYQSRAIESGENITVQFQGSRGVIEKPTGTLNNLLVDWMNTTSVEIRFSGLYIFFDRLAYLWQHYVVKEIVVSAYCHCNGQADGINCPYNRTLGDRQCVCQEGACGVQCDTCCPAYNQRPYKPGAKGPFIADKAAACEKCNCHNHSDMCVYNETVAKNNCSGDDIATNDDCSVNIDGNYNGGGGVCIDCKDNTEGINCQRCVTSYYRESGKSQWTKDACQPCECFINGTKNTTRNGVQYLDCVRDDAEAGKLKSDLKPGDCLCKNKTRGRRCDHCHDGYYNLTGENPEGCLACNCNTIGTVNASITCNDSGICFCKERVEGIKCTDCVKGTFKIADDNQYGCTKCICSGITTNCSSSTSYKDETKYNVSDWKLIQGLDAISMLPIMNIKVDVNGQSIDMISANISTEQPLYWMANETSFGGKSLVSAYGGNLRFTRKVSFAVNRTLEKDPQVILKGPRNVAIRQSLPSLVSGSHDAVSVSVKMVEFNWTDFKSGEAVSRSTFMLVLAKLEKIWITASYFTSGSDTYQTSLGDFRISSVSDILNGTVADDVEQCSCGEGYQGLSCERCARSYHRVNVSGHPFFGVCVPCNCHGHTLDCDPDTGECLNCQHNTTGFTCESCRDGFYGEARNGTSNDCQKCPCEPPRTTTDLCSLLPNGSAQCLNCSQGYEKNLKCNRCDWGYFGRPDLPGGSCSRCQCNNNSDICDRETGSCLGYCGNNSTGWHCERCENGTYGNATKQQCRACTCNVTGTYEIPCDHRTGQCHCKPNVKGFNCSSCKVNSFAFSDSGCTKCNCNEHGSTSLQCNNSGICSCRNFTHGIKCDACVDYYYGLPNATCQECACNSTGSNGTICDHMTGQCPCKPGVDGRQCDICKVQHKNFSDQGCEPCPRCTMKLQSRIDDANMTLLSLEMKMSQIKLSSGFYDDLKELEENVSRVEEIRAKYHQRAKQVDEYRLMHTNNTVNSTIDDIERQEREVARRVDDLKTRMLEELERKRSFTTDAERGYNLSISVNQTTQKIIDDLRHFVKNAADMNESSLDAIRWLNRSISEALTQQERHKNLSVLVEKSYETTKDAVEKVKNQTEKKEDIAKKINQYNSTFNGIKEKIENETRKLNKIQTEIDNVKELFVKVNETVRRTNLVLDQTSSYINDSNILMADGVVNYKKVQESLPKLHQDLKNLENAVSDVNNSIVAARVVVENASLHAQRLTAEAGQLDRAFSDARRHGERAVSSIERYEKFKKKINESIELSEQVNKLVEKLMSRIKNLTLSSGSLSQKALESKTKSSVFLEKTIARNISMPELRSKILRANQTLTEANTTCSKVAVFSDIFYSRSEHLNSTAAILMPAIEAVAHNATVIATKALNLSAIIKTETKELKKDLNMVKETHSKIKSLVANVSSLIGRTNNTVNKTGLILSNITQNINATLKLQQENNQRQKNLTAMMKTIEEKLRSAREKVAKFRLAMQLRGNTSVQLRPTARSISNPVLNEISLDFKTNSSTGLLLYMAPNPNNTHVSVSLKLVIDRVRFTYNLGGSPVVITNWEVVVSDNQWHRIYATRYREQARLTVTNLESGFSRTYEGPINRIYPSLYMNFTGNSSVFLGGVPTNQKVNFTERYFDGVVDNFVLNGETVNLWKPLAVEGRRRFAAKRMKPSNFSYCVTFHGNGFIQQRAGTFETRYNSSLRFQFRTFFKNAVLVVVEGSDTELVYNVSLKNGQVIFQYSNITLSSVKSSYSDGQWYDVYIARTLKNASLSVTTLSAPPGTQIQDNVNITLRLPIYLPSAEYVYFGGTNETRNRFAGGMKIVDLTSIITNAPVRRKLDDKNFTMVSMGVGFNECLYTVQEGLSYSGGYTALNAKTITHITSLSITFKTSEPSGILAYSVTKGVHFYVTLFHGNIFVIYGNGTTVERLQTNTETLNDGQYHTMQVNVRNSRIEMKVDTSSETISSKKLPVQLPIPVPLNDVLFIGGTKSPITVPFDVPVLKSFKGDVKSVTVNGNRILDGSSSNVFQLGISEHVSAAGVPPPTAPVPPTPVPTYPPTCAPRYPNKVRSERQEEVHFQGLDSYLFLNLDKILTETMRLSFVITVEFRALSPNGLLFLAVDNVTTPTQFVSLELVDGSLVYQFNAGEGLVRMKTKANYAIGGIWYTANLLRIRQFGAIVVPQNKEYHRNFTRDTVGGGLNVTSVFVGGLVKGKIDTSMLENPSAPSFFGCIRNVSIETSKLKKTFNLSGDAVVNLTRNIQPGYCYDNVQPQVSFDGSDYVKLDGPYNLSAGSELSIRFRTSKRSGVLFVAMDGTGGNKMVLEKVNGRIVLSYISSTKDTTLQWIDPEITSANTNSSFALCDNKFHTITVKRSHRDVELKVNKQNGVRANITGTEIFEAVYIGGVPSGLNEQIGSTGRRLIGCVESVIINGHMVDFRHEFPNGKIEFGCPAPIKPQTTYSDYNPLQVFTLI